MDKKILAILIIVLAPLLILHGQTVKVASNEGIELMNTVWVLANGAADTATSRDVSERFGAFTEHEAVKLLRRRSSESAIHYVRNFEQVILPCMGLKIGIGAGGEIGFDMGELEEGKMLYPYWKREMMESFLHSLGDFYRCSKFHDYYIAADEQNQRAIEAFERVYGNIDMSKVNGILGSKIKEVQFIAPITRLSKEYSVPFVFVDGEPLPMFYDADSELQHPSHFAPFNILSPYGNDPLLGLLTALYVREEHTQERWDGGTPGFIHAVSEILKSYCRNCDTGGFQVWNFMSRWMPILLANEYCKDDEHARAQYIRKADEMGFVWHRDAIDFMQYYYQDRDKYKTIADFMPQIKAYVAYLPEILDELTADYDAAMHPYAISVYPAPNTVLDMSGDSIEIVVRFSQAIMENSTVTIGINSLYKDYDQRLATDYSLPDRHTLKFRMETKTAKEIGFYGISIISIFHENKYEYLNPDTRDFNITYFQPKQ